MLRKLTIERTMIVVLFLLVALMATRPPLDGDTGWHVAGGRWMLENGGVLSADPFSHTFTGVYRIGHDWLAQIKLALIDRWLGDFGLALFTVGYAVAGMAFIYAASRGSTYLRAFVVALAAASATIFWTARPQMFSFAFAAVTLWVILTTARGASPRRLWILPPLMLAWVQVHAGWSIGFILLGCAVLGEAIRYAMHPAERAQALARGRALALIGIACAAVLPLNPYGLDMLRVPFETISIGPLTQFIQEWLPPDFSRGEFWPFALLLLVTILLAVIQRRSLTPFFALALLISAILSLRAARNISFFATVAAPFVCIALDDLLARRGITLRTVGRPSLMQARLNVALIGVIGAAVILNLVAQTLPVSMARAEAALYPVDALAAMRQADSPRELFNDYNWGGWLIDNAPEYPVLIDGRTDLYRDFVLTYAQAVSAQPNMSAILDQYAIRTVLVTPQAGIAAALKSDPAWRVLYEDQVAAVFVRQADFVEGE